MRRISRSRMEAEIETLRQLVEINTRRIEELEATAFQLDEEEEVICAR